MVDLEALTGHTPGPWKVDENGPSVIGEGGAMPICDMRGWGRLTGQGIGGRALAPGVARGIQQSNAALCAAAPDLIAEVRALRAERDALKLDVDELYIRQVPALRARVAELARLEAASAAKGLVGK